MLFDGITGEDKEYSVFDAQSFFNTASSKYYKL